MPGIFGVASTAPADDVSRSLTRMAVRMRHYPWYEECRHLEDGARVGLGRMALDFAAGANRPAWNEDQTLTVLLDGDLYDYDEQRHALAAAGHHFRGDAPGELLAHGFESEGMSFFARLHGKFVAVLWDRTKRQLILVNDRFGMRPLYYAALPGRFLFATEIKALLTDPKVSRRPYLPGVAQFFTFGHLLGEDTLFEGVRLLPAAGLLTYQVSSGRLTVGRYWSSAPRQSVPPRSEAETLDRIADAFDRAVDRCTRGPARLGLSLSGGLDSRTILAAVDEERPLTTVSMGMDGSVDHRSATEMARLVGRPHHQCVLDDRFLGGYEGHLRHMIHLTDGQYLSQCVVMPTLPVYRDLGIQALLRGHAGELMHMTKAYNYSLDQEALAARNESELENWLFRHLQTYMMEGTEGRLFATTHRGEMEELARVSLQSCLRATEGITPPVQQVWHLFLSQRLRRETALSLVKFGSLVETRVPFLDNDLVDTLLDAPPALKLGEAIQYHIIRRRRPGLLGVVNVNTGARMGAGRVARFAGKLRQKVLAKLGVKGYQPYERLGLWLRRELRPLVHNVLLAPRCLERGLFDPDTVRQVVERHTAGRQNHTFLIMAMMIFELGQQAFADEQGDLPQETKPRGELCLR